MAMNEQEFFCLIEDTKKIVFAAIRKYLPAHLHHAIDDVAQETYIRVYKGIGKATFADIRARNNWIYTIARNESLRMSYKHGREDAKASSLRDSLLMREDSGPDPADADTASIRETISALPPKYRDIFELLMLGCSESQIAEKLTLKRGTIKSRIHRGRELIHRDLRRRGITYELQ